MSAPQLAGSSEATATATPSYSRRIEEGNKSPTFPREGWRFLRTLPLVDWRKNNGR